MTMEFWDNLIRSIKGEAKLHVTMEEIRRQMLIVETSFRSAENNECIKCEI